GTPRVLARLAPRWRTLAASKSHEAATCRDSRRRVRWAHRGARAAQGSSADHADRSPQPPPVPAAALSGRHRGAQRERHRVSDPVQQREWLPCAVVGAGPTGVELAGALGEIGLHTLANDFRCIDPTQVRVVLFEGNDRVLTAYPPKLSAAAKRELEKRHVE